MKKGLFSIVMVMALGLSSFAAKTNVGSDVSPAVMNAFHKQFASAENVSWEEKEGQAKAAFTLGGQVFFACYNNNGDLVSVMRNIVSGQLPIKLLTSVKSDYKDCWISDLYETATDHKSTYYLTLENADYKIVLRSNGTTNWEELSRTSKEMN